MRGGRWIGWVFAFWAPTRRGPVARVSSLGASGNGDRRYCRRHRRDPASDCESTPRRRRRRRVGAALAVTICEHTQRRRPPAGADCERTSRNLGRCRIRQRSPRPKQGTARIRRAHGGAGNHREGEGRSAKHRPFYAFCTAVDSAARSHPLRDVDEPKG